MNEKGTLTKDVLIEMISEKIGYPVKESKEMLESLLEIFKADLENGKNLKVSGFGLWKVSNKKSRRGRNPATGEEMKIDARRVVTFHPSDILRERVDQLSKVSS